MIESICTKLGVSADYILGINENLFRDSGARISDNRPDSKIPIVEFDLAKNYDPSLISIDEMLEGYLMPCLVWCMG